MRIVISLPPMMTEIVIYQDCVSWRPEETISSAACSRSIGTNRVRLRGAARLAPTCDNVATFLTSDRARRGRPRCEAGAAAVRVIVLGPGVRLARCRSLEADRRSESMIEERDHARRRTTCGRCWTASTSSGARSSARSTAFRRSGWRSRGVRRLVGQEPDGAPGVLGCPRPRGDRSRAGGAA